MSFEVGTGHPQWGINAELIESAPTPTPNIDAWPIETSALLGKTPQGYASTSTIGPPNDHQIVEDQERASFLRNAFNKALSCIHCCNSNEDNASNRCCTCLGNIRLLSSSLTQPQPHIIRKTADQVVQELHDLVDRLNIVPGEWIDETDTKKIIKKELSKIFRCEIVGIPSTGMNDDNRNVLMERCIETCMYFQQENEGDLKIRLNNLVHDFSDHLNEINQRVQKDQLLLSETFLNRVEVRSFIIHLSGSETHEHGRSVAFITFNSREDQKIVYKPRDMRVDALLADNITKGLFSMLNRHLQKLPEGAKIELPTYTILPIQDQEGGKSYGYCQFLSHSADDNTLTENEMTNYYRTIGALQFVAQVFGITDLHQENVLVHDKKPFLIDLEVSFNLMAFQQNPVSTDLITAVIMSGLRRQGLVKTSQNEVRLKTEDTILEIDEHFTENSQKYFNSILNGFESVKQIFLRDNAVRTCEEFIDNIPKDLILRYIPISTGDFFMYMYGLEPTTRTAETLRNKNSPSELLMEKNDLKRNVGMDFAHVDIPKMTLDLSGNVFYNGEG